MYRYEESDKSLEELNEFINGLTGKDYVYRVIYNGINLILIFYELELLDKFMNKYISRYTCDTSGMTKMGLSLILDSSTAKSVLSKIYYSHEFKRRNKSSHEVK